MDWINKNNLLKWPAVILIILNILLLAFIWLNIFNKREPMGMKNPGPPPNADNFFKKELNLSEQQVRLFESKRKEFFSSSDQLFNKMNKLQNELNDNLLKQENNSDIVDSLTGQIGDVQAALEKLRFNHFKNLLNICSPEQREKFIPILKKIMANKPPNGKDGSSGFPKDNKHGKPPSGQRD